MKKNKMYLLSEDINKLADSVDKVYSKHRFFADFLRVKDTIVRSVNFILHYKEPAYLRLYRNLRVFLNRIDVPMPKRRSIIQLPVSKMESGVRLNFSKLQKFYERFEGVKLEFFNFSRVAGVFASIFALVFLFTNAESLFSVSKYYLATNAFVTDYITDIKNEVEYVKANTLVEGSEEMRKLEEERENQQAGLPAFDLEISPDQNRIEIPRIKKNIPISNVENEAIINTGDQKAIEDEIQKALENGVVRYPGTAVPGERGNVFLTGHSSYYLWAKGGFKDVFALLHQVELGDEIVVYYGSENGNQRRFDYVVEEIKEVKPSEVDVLRQTDDHRLTLMTCTPLGTSLRRLIVIAKPVSFK